MKTVIVTSANYKYQPLLDELIDSIRAHPQSKSLSLAVLDAGLDELYKEKLKTKKIKVFDGVWPKTLNLKKVEKRQFLKACVSRPYIPDLLPGYDIYIWLDADTWIQDWSAIDLLIEGAKKSQFAVVPQVDRSYGKTMRLKWIGAMPFRPRSFYYSNARKAFSGKMAREMFPYPTVNAGVFAMAGNAPHWKHWQGLIEHALKRGKVFTAEQLTMGIMIWKDKFSAELLPAPCNWLCETKPLWDTKQKCFIEPYLPHQKIGIMHLSGYDSMRVHPDETTEVMTLSGDVVQKSLRFQR